MLLLLCLTGLIIAGGCLTADSQARKASTRKWGKDLMAFAEADRNHPPQAGGTLFVGSSSFRMWDTLSASFPERRVINRGFGGSEMHDLLALTDLLVRPYSPSEILVYEGDNDVANQVAPAQIALEFRQFAQRVHRKFPQTTIYFVSIKPSPSRAHLMSRAREANRQIRDYCATQEWLRYIDVASPMLDAGGQPRRDIFLSDNLHLNPAGYALWTQIIRRELGLSVSPDTEPAWRTDGAMAGPLFSGPVSQPH